MQYQHQMNRSTSNRILELRKNEVTPLRELGSGKYGKVSLVYVYDRQLGIRTICAAKTVKSEEYFSSSEDQAGDDVTARRELDSLKNELDIYERLQDHPNFPRLIGAIRDDNNFTIVTEYVEGGDLRKFLQQKAREGLFIEQPVGDSDYHESTTFKRYVSQAQWASRFNKPSSIGSVTSSTLVYIALQIANALKYLVVDLKILHRDIAARNVLITGDFVIKITDFGLARDDDYYQASTMALPFLYLALETLQTYKFTAHSEVWQFGVLLYEVFSLGKRPYCDQFSEYTDNRPEKLQKFLEGGGRLVPPQRMPEPIKRLMVSCFLEIPEKRPTFERITKILHDLLKFMSPELSSKIDGSSQLDEIPYKEGYLESRANRFVKSRTANFSLKMVNVGPRMTNSLPPISIKNREYEREEPRSPEIEPEAEAEYQENDEGYNQSDWVQLVLKQCDPEYDNSKESSQLKRASLPVSPTNPTAPLEIPTVSPASLKNDLESGRIEPQDEMGNKTRMKTFAKPVRRSSAENLLPLAATLPTSVAPDKVSREPQANQNRAVCRNIILPIANIILPIILCVGGISLLLFLIL